jgi:hypothetical protein
MILLFQDPQLILVLSQQVNIVFQVCNDNLFLVRLDFEWGVEVWGAGFGGAHVFLWL